MTNTEYVNTLLQFNDIIYIDTSSLMNVQDLRMFLDNYQQYFIKFFPPAPFSGVYWWK